MARLFIGVELEPGVAAAAANAAGALRDRLAAARIAVAARWTPRENLHLTLWFIGDVADERARTIHDALAPPFARPAFDARLAGLGAFPPAGRPRVFWIGLQSGAAPMQALHAELAGRLAPLGFQAERRPFAAHLTIARVKAIEPRSAGLRVRRILLEGRIDAGVTRISAVTLFSSRLSPKGSTYTPLLRVPLS